MADECASCADIDGDVTGTQNGRFLTFGRSQTQTNAGEELVEGEGLAHIVIGSAREPGHCVFDGFAGSEDDDGQIVAFCADHPQHTEAVEAGQPQVEDDEIEAAAADEFDGQMPVTSHLGGEALGSEALGDERRDPVFVLNNENARQ